MPRNIRNFWIELTVDGKKSRVATGPRGKDGGFRLVVKMRDNGNIIDALGIEGDATGDRLRLFTWNTKPPVSDEGPDITIETRR